MNDLKHTICKDGDQVLTATPVIDIQVPDLWNLAMSMKEGGNIRAYEAILNTWHLAHAMKDRLQQQELNL